jgi:hypothetical protein
LESLINLYRQIKTNDHGFASNIENRNSGSKLNLLPELTLKLKITAGFPNEKEGINENPLLVALTEPLTFKICFVLSVCCEKVV